MRIAKLAGLPAQPGETTSEHFGTLWEIELEAGETTRPQELPTREGLYLWLDGSGEVVVGDRRERLARGSAVFVPRGASHFIAAAPGQRLRCVSVESAAAEAEAPRDRSTVPETIGKLEKQIQQMPAAMNQAEAIQEIVRLFDIAGRLSEQIEEAFGLDNEEGVAALTRIEQRIMAAVVEITRRYERGQSGLEGFGGRLRSI